MKIANRARNKPPRIRIDFLFPTLTKDAASIDIREIDSEIQQIVKDHGGSTRIGLVKGEWINPQRKQIKDELHSFYVITPDIPAITNEYLPKLRERLEKQFKQDEVLITYHSVILI